MPEKAQKNCCPTTGNACFTPTQTLRSVLDGALHTTSGSMTSHPRSARRVLRPTLLLFWLLLALCCLWQPSYGATAVTLSSRLTETEIYLGESTSLELRLQGIRNPEVPEWTHPDIAVSKAGGQSFNNASYSMINGQVRQTEEVGYVAHYTLRPQRAGVLDIPPIVLVHEGQTYRSNSLTLRVQQPQAQDTLIVEVQPHKPSYVLGETVTLTLDVSIRKLLSNGTVIEADPFFREQPPHLQIPWFESLGDWKTTDLRTFAQPLLGQQQPGFFVNEYRRESMFQSGSLTFTFPRRTTTRATSSGPVAYFTYQLHKQFRPTKAGPQPIPPVSAKASLPTQVDARGRAVRTEKFVASSAPLTVDIRPVPTAGQPAHFSGAVGRFQLEVEANPKILRVGDPLNVTLTLRGAGLLETVRAPDLERQEALSQDFKVQADPPAVKTESDAKTFTYTLRPRHVGIRALPPIATAFYDPDTQRFQVLRSTPVPLRVDAASTLDVADVVDPTAEGQAKNVLGQELTEGILANYGTSEELLTRQDFRIQLGWFTWLFLVLPPLAYVATSLWRWRARWQQQRPEYQRVRQAAARALAALQTLQTQHEPGETALWDGVHQALTGYVGDKLTLVGAGLTVEDVVRHLQARQVEPALLAQVTVLLQRCDSARYAPGALAVEERTGALEDAAALVQRLEASGHL